jgi:hypothetical protein
MLSVGEAARRDRRAPDDAAVDPAVDEPLAGVDASAVT